MPSAKDGGASACPKCGVVFAKLEATGSNKSARSRAPGSARRPVQAGFSSKSRAPGVTQVTGLFVLLVVVAGAVWLWLAPPFERSTPPARRSDPAPPSETSAKPAVEPAPSPDFSPLPPGTETGMAAGNDAAPTAVPGTSVHPRSLPTLTPETITPTVLAEAIELAQQDPENTFLKGYVFRAHLILAAKSTAQGGHDQALGYLDGAENWGAPEETVVTQRALVYGRQERWNDAARWGQRAIDLGTREMAEMYYFIGKAAYDRGQFDDAVLAFRAAIAIQDLSRYRMALEATNRMATRPVRADEKRLSHFYVTYQGETMETTGRMVLDSLERSHASLVSALGFEPPEPVAVILYSRREYTEMGGPHWSAGYFDGRIHVAARGLSRVDPQLQITLHHELAHAFVHAKAGQGVPRWLHEGVAQYVEGMDSRRAGPILASIVKDGGSLEACVLSARCDVRVFYPAAASLVDYMVQLRGMGGIKDLLEELSRGDDMDGALTEVLGKDQAMLIRDWEHFVKRRYG